MGGGSTDDGRRRRPTLYGVGLVTAVTLGPFAGFAQRNRGQITQSGRLLVYATVATLITLGVLWLVVALVRRDADRLALVVAAVVTSFLSFSVLFDPNELDAAKLLGSYVAWGLLTVAFGRLAYLAGRNALVRTGVATFAWVLLVSSCAGYILVDSGHEPMLAIEDPGILDVPVARPNVYWFVLDAYARPDVMESVVGLDDSQFVTSLERSGFQVSMSSRTSYPRTHQSLSSTLQMDYPLKPGHHVTDDIGMLGPVVVGRNNTVRRFEALGYDVAYASAGGAEWSKCRRELVDVCLPLRRPFPPTGELEQTLLDLTPLGALRLPVPYSDPVQFADALDEPNSGLEEPFFAFIHVLSPHFPFRYRSDCSARETPLSELRMTETEQVEAYREQVPCATGAVTEAVDEILARDPDAIILIQSDHGSEIEFTWDDHPDVWTARQLNERYGVFNAMRLPEGCDTDIEGAALVNTFRIVFGCIEGHEPDLLPYRAFGHPFFGLGDLQELDEERFTE